MYVLYMWYIYICVCVLSMCSICALYVWFTFTYMVYNYMAGTHILHENRQSIGMAQDRLSEAPSAILALMLGGELGGINPQWCLRMVEAMQIVNMGGY